jgi:hypothetical protein
MSSAPRTLETCCRVPWPFHQVFILTYGEADYQGNPEFPVHRLLRAAGEHADVAAGDKCKDSHGIRGRDRQKKQAQNVYGVSSSWTIMGNGNNSEPGSRIQAESWKPAICIRL